MRTNLLLEDDISIMITNNLTPNELFAIKVIFLAIEGYSDPLVNYFNNTSSDFREVLISLQDKGIINKSFVIPEKGKSVNFKRIPFNKNFINKYMKSSGTLGSQLWDAYVDGTYIQGKYVSLKNFVRQGNLSSMEDFFLFYSKSINHNIKKHEEIMELLEWGKENDMICWGIYTFVAENKWEFLRKVRDGEIDANGYQNTELI